MHLIYLFYQGLIIFALLIGDDCQETVNIGIVNRKWKDILDPKITGRNWTSRFKFNVISVPANLTFYESINYAHEMIYHPKISLIIGDSRLDIAQAAASLSVPFISFDNKLMVRTKAEYKSTPHFYSLPVSETSYALATVEILRHFQISQVAIVIDTSVDYQMFVKPFLEMTKVFCKVWTIPIYSSENEGDSILNNILKEIRSNGHLDIILKINKNNLNKLMGLARYLGMISIPYRWYIVGFVCENFNINTLKHIFSNFTFINERCTERNLLENSNYEDVAMVEHFIQIIRAVKWKFSPNDLNKILRDKSQSFINFDSQGNRNSFTLFYNTISRLPNKTLSMIGSYLKRPDMSGIFVMKIDKSDIPDINLFPKHFRIVALEEHPHLIVENNVTNVGFGVDLIAKLSEILNFTYTINVIKSKDGMEGKWTKFLAELIEGRADLSLGPVVQTRDREANLDFSTSFKQREISLVMKKPTSSISFFQFLAPFSNNIWYCVAAAVVLLSIMLWILERYHDKYFPEKDTISFDWKESSWFVVASTLQGGTEYVPYSIPGRILTTFLYFFVLIIVTSYTANLAAFLTVKAYTNPIGSVDDLANLPPKSEIKFGTVKSSPIYDFFKHSELEIYNKIYKIMAETKKGWLVQNTTEGYLRAMKEDYVFLWDDSVNQYETLTEQEYKCKLYVVGLPFGKRSFALGMPQGSTYKENINTALLTLLESGVIEKLEHKWWKSTSKCPDSSALEISSEELNVNDLAGVFLILFCGVIIAIISLLIEILMKKKIISQCCSQFFSRLPSSSPPPIMPKKPKTTLDHSRYSTMASSMKSDIPRSPRSDESTHILSYSAKFDFALDSDSQNKSTPV